jgi:predicted RNase H-like nuclease
MASRIVNQISSTEKLLMSASDMTDNVKNPHPNVPFTTIGDDTSTPLSQLVAIFKDKFQKPSAPELMLLRTNRHQH